MSSISTLTARPREKSGKGEARAIRKQGFIPAIIYGDNAPPQMVGIDSIPFQKELSVRGLFSRQIDLEINGKKHRVLTRDIQFHPVSDAPLHIDFLRVSETTRVTVQVAVVFRNEADSPGLKRGGVLNVVRHSIEINTSVANIPDQFEIDLTGLEVGDSVHISAVNLPEGVVSTIQDRDFTIATIAAPSAIKSSAEEEDETEEAEAEEADSSEETPEKN